MSAADISRQEKYSRCVALEEDYVHQVYESIGKNLAQAKDPMKDTVRKFLDELEPGSLVADIGCGDGRHLQEKSDIFSVGAERSNLQASLARQRCQEVLLGDNLKLPFRSNAFDAALSVEVLHHFTTKERRIEALKEISRILKIGGRALITVQRHTNKISQDVLIPWFDVPKEKKGKESQWLEDDTFEYGDNNEDEEDEDSISLPSTDEEDSPWINNAKFFPSKIYNPDHVWSPQNLCYDSTTASNHVPNKQQLVQNNTCYAFVQRAFKRFSTENNANSDRNLRSQFGTGEDAAVLLESVSINEQKIGLSNCSSSNLSESLLRTISDNFIELPNIDIDDDTSKLSTLGDCMSDTLSRENSKLIQKKCTVIRSLSDIFKNINSFLSSKGTKSCSDLQHLAATEISAKRNEYIRNRLVRSRTTTTCSPELDRVKSLDNKIGFDMTINEANKIIKNILESSTQETQNIRSAECAPDVLTHSDIVNGNTLPLESSNAKNLNSQEKFKSPKKNLVSKMPLLKEEDFYHADLTNDVHREKKSLYERESYDSDKNGEFYTEPQLNLYSNPRSYSKPLIYPTKNNYGNDKINNVSVKEENYVFDRTLLEAQLRKEYSFLYDDESDEEEIKCFDINESKENSVLYQQDNFTEISSLEESFFEDRNFYYFGDLNPKPFQSRNSETNYIVKTSTEFDMNNTSVLYRKNSFTHNDTSIDKFSKPFIDSYVECCHSKLDDVCEFDCCIGPSSSNSKCFLQNSPKKLRNVNPNDNYQESEIYTLGPFYDEDNESSYTNADFPLASYYSMPELRALSEFYEEYRLYQNYLLDTFTADYPNYQYAYGNDIDLDFSKKNAKVKDIVQKSEMSDGDYKNKNTRTESKIQISKLSDIECKETDVENKKELQSAKEIDFSSKIEKSDLKECVISESSIEHMKRELCNNIQTAFTSTNTNIVENKNDIVPTIPEITLDNEKSDISFSFQIKSDSFSDLDNKLASNFCLNDKRSAIECYNSSIFLQSLGMSRSCSSLLENANLNKLVEIPSISNISASQPSLKFSPKRDLKLNLNKYRLNQINLYHSLSTDILVDEDIFSNNLKRTPDKNIYNKQNMCALKEIKRDTDDSIRIITNILEKSPHEVSYISSLNPSKNFEKSPVLNKTAENCELKPYSQLLDNSNSYIENGFNNEDSSIYANCRNSNSIKDAYCKNHHNPRVLENSVRNNQLFNSSENSDFTENCVYSIRDLTKLEQKFYINEFSDELLSNKVDYVEKSSLSDTSSQNFTHSVIHHKHSPHTNSSQNSSHFTPENISKTEMPNSLLHVTDSLQDKRNTKCSAERRKQPMDCISTSNSPSIITTKIDQTPVEEESYLSSEHMELDPAHCSPKSRSEHSMGTTGIEDECINYTYGRIHDDGASVVSHRYHHLFQEEELYDLIENNISDLHVLDSFVEELHLYIIAEKVRVWTI